MIYSFIALFAGIGILGLVPTSAINFIIGSLAGPIVFALFQAIKKYGPWLDTRPVWEKKAYIFIIGQVVTTGAALLGNPDIHCSIDAASVMDCLNQLTPEVLKGFFVTGSAMGMHYLKKMPSA